MDLTFNLALGSTIFLAVCLLLSLAAGNGSRTVNHRVLQATRTAIPERRKNAQMDERLLRVLRALRGRLGISENDRLRGRFIAAGLKSGQSTELYFAARMLLPVAGILGGSFITANPLMAILAFVAAGYLTPDFWLDRKIKAAANGFARAFPTRSI